MGADGRLEGIIEAKDATPRQREELALCNSGLMAVDAAQLFDLLDRVTDDNAKGEYYLPPTVSAWRPRTDCPAVSSRAKRANFWALMTRPTSPPRRPSSRTRGAAAALAAGATLIDPSTVWLAHDTELAADAIVHPNVVFGPGVTVAPGAEIRSFSHIEGARIGPGAVIGPFARLRPDTQVGANARVGNFVRAKNSAIGDDAKINHLAYVGDAEIGTGTNIGAGVITL